MRRYAFAYIVVLVLASSCTLNESPFEYLADGSMRYKRGPTPVAEDTHDPDTYKGHVHLKVKFKATEYLNTQDFEEGQVHVTFWIRSNGHILDVQIDPKQSTTSENLHQAAKDIILASAPFKSFPDDVKADDMKFNVIINFKTKTKP